MLHSQLATRSPGPPARELEIFARKRGGVQTCVGAAATCLFKKYSAQGLCERLARPSQLIMTTNQQLSRRKTELCRLFGLSGVTMLCTRMKKNTIFFCIHCSSCNFGSQVIVGKNGTSHHSSACSALNVGQRCHHTHTDKRRRMMFSCTLSAVMSRC